MKKHTPKELVSETELSRLTGKSREWVRRRLTDVERSADGKYDREAALATLNGECDGRLIEMANPLRWVAEKSVLCFIETAFRDENRDLWESIFRGMKPDEIADRCVRAYGILHIVADAAIDADLFSRSIAAHSEGEDIDGLWTRIMGPASKFRFHKRRATESPEITFPAWLRDAAQRLEASKAKLCASRKRAKADR